MQLKQLILTLNQLGNRGCAGIDWDFCDDEKMKQIDKFWRDYCPPNYRFAAVFAIDVSDAIDDDFTSAIALCECRIWSNNSIVDNPGKYIGSVFYLWRSTKDLTPEDIENNWDKVCKMMDW